MWLNFSAGFKMIVDSPKADAHTDISREVTIYGPYQNISPSNVGKPGWLPEKTEKTTSLYLREPKI